MRKLYQTRLHEGMYPVEKRGNCFPTVLACVMDLDSPEDVFQVQEYYDDKSWPTQLKDWLSDKGWALEKLDGHLNDDSFYFVTGLSSRGSNHICIFKNGVLFHDPHPEGNGLLTQAIFEKLEKAKSFKECFKCCSIKPITEFYKHSRMLDGHLNKCKTCTKKDSAKALKEKISTEEGLEKERARHREKYYRLNYKEVHKPTPEKKKQIIEKYQKKYPEKRKAIILSQRIPKTKPINHLHHWNYSLETAKDVIEMDPKQHKELHRYLIYCPDRFIYKTKDDEVLDTKEKHVNFIKKLGLKIY